MTASAMGSSPTTSVLGADCPANLPSSFPSGREGSGSGWYPRKRAAAGGATHGLKLSAQQGDVVGCHWLSFRNQS